MFLYQNFKGFLPYRLTRVSAYYCSSYCPHCNLWFNSFFSFPFISEFCKFFVKIFFCPFPVFCFCYKIQEERFEQFLYQEFQFELQVGFPTSLPKKYGTASVISDNNVNGSLVISTIFVYCSSVNSSKIILC